MNVIGKYLLLCSAALCLTASPARAQEQDQVNYYNADAPIAAGMPAPDADIQPSHNVIVTSINKCYEQLGRAETLNIEANYVKPYEECQRRLAIKLKKKQQAGAKAPNINSGREAPGAGDSKDAKDSKDSKDSAEAKDQPDNTPAVSGGFYQVQKPADLKDKKPSDAQENNSGNAR